MVARQKQLQTFGKVLEKRFEVKQTGHIGFGANDKKELKILNRTIKIDVLNDEMTLEADTKLVENALESMKLNGAKGVDSPRVRRTEEQTAQIENSEKLTSAESTLYRSLVMKLAYVAQDRVDIAEAVKCLTRHMKEPRSGHMQELKRLGRYLVKNRRCVLTYARQTTDADVAGTCGLGLGWRSALKEEHDKCDRLEEANICCDTCHVCRRLSHCQAEKLKTTLHVDRFTSHVIFLMQFAQFFSCISHCMAQVSVCARHSIFMSSMMSG